MILTALLYIYSVLTALLYIYNRPHITPAIAEDCYILVVLFSFLFYHRRFFNVPRPIFAEVYHTTRCVLKYFISYVSVHMCPLKNLRGEKLQFLRICGPKIDTLSPAIPECRENQEI